jgi:hypothetical protein
LTVVLDSNVAVALALDTERAPAIEDRLRAWEEAKELFTRRRSFASRWPTP